MAIRYIFPRQCENRILNYKGLLQEFSDWFDVHGEEIHFDCSSVEFVYPFGLNLLSSMMYMHQQNNNKVFINPPANAGVSKYLSDQGFYDEFSITGSKSSQQVWHSTRPEGHGRSGGGDRMGRDY